MRTFRPHRTRSGDVRHASPESAFIRVRSRARDRERHSANDGGCPAGRAWFALPRLAPAGAEGLGVVEVGVGEGSQSRVQVLPAEAGRKEAPRCGGVEVVEPDRRRRANHVAGGGDLICAGGGGTGQRIWTANSGAIWNWKPKNDTRLACRRTRPTMR